MDPPWRYEEQHYHVKSLVIKIGRENSNRSKGGNVGMYEFGIAKVSFRRSKRKIGRASCRERVLRLV